MSATTSRAASASVAHVVPLHEASFRGLVDGAGGDVKTLEDAKRLVSKAQRVDQRASRLRRDSKRHVELLRKVKADRPVSAKR